MDLEPNPSMLIRSAIEGDYEELCEIMNSAEFEKSVINQALFQAVSKSQSASDHLRCVERLLTQGNPNFKDQNGVSLLMIAAKLGQIQLAELLMDCGSTVDDKDKEMKTALMYAVESCYGDNVDVVKFLLEKKAKVNTQDLQGNSPLHHSAERGYFNSMQVLLDFGAYINTENKEKNTPLHLASKNGFELCVELLISKKANIYSTNTSNKTPQDLAQEHIKYLFDKPQYTNSDSSFCSMSSHTEIICKLCKKNLNEGICRICHESSLQLTLTSAQDNKKLLEECQKELFESKQAIIEANKKIKSKSEACESLRKIITDKEIDIKKKDSEIQSLNKALKDLSDQKEQEINEYMTKLREAEEDIISLKEHLLNVKSESKLHRTESELLRRRLDEYNQKETDLNSSPLGKQAKKPNKKLSYIKNFLRPDRPNHLLLLRDEISTFMQEIERWQEEVEPVYNELTTKMRRIIKKKFTSSEVEVYGSYATKLHLPSSDIDMVIANIPGDKRDLLQLIEKLLKSHQFIKSTTLIKATVPLIKVRAELLGRTIFVDITISDPNHSGIKCLGVVNRLLAQHSGIRPIFLILKQLFYVCNFKEPYNGGLGSYSLFLMVASFFQKKNEVREKLKGENWSVAECLNEILHFYANQNTYLNPIITQDPSNFGIRDRGNYDGYFSLNVIDPMNSINNVAISTNMYKLIHIFNIADYSLKRFCLCECVWSSCPLYRMIYETKEYIKN